MYNLYLDGGEYRIVYRRHSSVCRPFVYFPRSDYCKRTADPVSWIVCKSSGWKSGKHPLCLGFSSVTFPPNGSGDQRGIPSAHGRAGQGFTHCRALPLRRPPHTTFSHILLPFTLLPHITGQASLWPLANVTSISPDSLSRWHLILLNVRWSVSSHALPNTGWEFYPSVCR